MDPTGPTSYQAFRSCHVAIAGLATWTYLLPIYFSGISPTFSNFFLFLALPPLWAAVSKILANLWPQDKHHHDYHVASYQPILVSTTSAAAVATGRVILSAGFHSRRHLSIHFPVPSSLLWLGRPPRQLSLADAEILRPGCNRFRRCCQFRVRFLHFWSFFFQLVNGLHWPPTTTTTTTIGTSSDPWLPSVAVFWQRAPITPLCPFARVHLHPT